MNFLNIVIQALAVTILIVMLMIITEFINLQLNRTKRLLKPLHPLAQIVLAALIGLIPGCVGIFIVISLFTHGKLSTAALLAACITALGDEAFFMFAFVPCQTLYIIAIIFALAVAAGIVFHLFFRSKHIFQSQVRPSCVETFDHHCTREHTHIYRKGKVWLFKSLCCAVLAVFIIGALAGLLYDSPYFCGYFSFLPHAIHFHSEIEHHHTGHSWENIVFAVLAGATSVLILCSDHHFFEEHILKHIFRKHLPKILVWVAAVMLLIAVLMYFVDVSSFVQYAYGKYFLLLTALLIGLIPQSGPHLIILFFYINGFVPFTTLLANSIVQEGHGGLALIASNPQKLIRIKIIKLGLASIIGLAGLL
jgi:hypothetical protein